MTTEERLLAAIHTGGMVRVVYHGGSQPGTVREITPAGIRDGKVRAFCHTSQAMKLFAVEKISIIDDEETPGLPSWQPGFTPTPRYTSIEMLLEEHRNDFVKRGWFVQSDTGHLSLHRTFKNGKPMKGSDVSLDFEEYAFDLIMDEEGAMHEENLRKKQRPWMVKAKNKDTRTYGSLDAAAALFMEWGESLAPTFVGQKPESRCETSG